MAEKRWKDEDGMEAVFRDGRLSICGRPSMTADDGTVAVGIDADWITEVPAGLTGEEAEMLYDLLRDLTHDRERLPIENSALAKLRATLRGPGEPPEGSGGKA